MSLGSNHVTRLSLVDCLEKRFLDFSAHSIGYAIVRPMRNVFPTKGCLRKDEETSYVYWLGFGTVWGAELQAIKGKRQSYMNE